jgi:hypothetical protein
LQNKKRQGETASPSFGGVARFIPRNIEIVWRNHILSYISKKNTDLGGKRKVGVSGVIGAASWQFLCRQ